MMCVSYSSHSTLFSSSRIRSRIQSSWIPICWRPCLGQLAKVWSRQAWCALGVCARLCCACLQVMKEREAIITDLEKRAAQYWQSGQCERWMSGADPHVKRVSATVCGPLIEELCDSTRYWDKTCVELFRKGYHDCSHCLCTLMCMLFVVF